MTGERRRDKIDQGLGSKWKPQPSLLVPQPNEPQDQGRGAGSGGATPSGLDLGHSSPGYG